MRERVMALGTPGGGVTGQHVPPPCARSCGSSAEPAGIAVTSRSTTADDQLRLVKEAIAKLDLPAISSRPPKSTRAISDAKNALRTPEAFARPRKTSSARSSSPSIAEYEKLLAGNHALDFDDLLCCPFS